MSMTIGEDSDGAHDDDPLWVLNATGEASLLREALRERGISVTDIDQLAKWNVDAVTGEDHVGRVDNAEFHEELARRKGQITRVLDEAMAAALASGERYAPVWLLAYVVYEIDETWEVSYHFEPMWATLAYLNPLWTNARPRVDHQVATAGDAVLRLASDLDAEIRAENAMNCGFLRESGRFYQLGHRAALAAVAEAARLGERLGPAPLADFGHGVTAFVGDWAASSMVYDEACATAAQAIAAFLDGAGDLESVLPPLTAADAELRQTYLDAEPFPGDKEEGQDWSELHANRLDVQALHDLRGEQWLSVDDGTIVYLYPFALRPRRDAPELPPHSIDYYERWVRTADPGAKDWTLAGVRPTNIHREFRLDDVWHGTDPDHRRFDGVRIELPEASLRMRADGPVLATLQAELRLSKLGNHHLRFEGRLRDAGPLDMYMALLRAAPEHGALAVTFGAREWPRLATLAMKLIADLERNLDREVEHHGARRTAREGMFQVLVTIDAASTRTGPGPAGPRTEVTSIDRLRAAAGAPILFTPVSHVMTSLAEWSRFQLPRGTVVDHDRTQARRGRAVVRTVNTTLHIALGAPHWELNTALSVSEFVATLEGLFARWMEQLSDFQNAVNEQRQRIAETEERTADDLNKQVEELRDIRLALQTFVTDCRSTIALIQSPALVRSPVVASELAAMVEASGVARRAAEFDHRAREVLSDRLDEIIERAANDKEEKESKLRHDAESKHRVRMDTLLAIIAAVGVSGLGQILQAGYGLSGRESLEITMGIVALALVVGFAVYALARAALRVAEKRIAKEEKARRVQATRAAQGTARPVPAQHRRSS